MEAVPTVFVLDDDESFVRALDRLLRAEGFDTRTWTSAKTFLAEHDLVAAGLPRDRPDHAGDERARIAAPIVGQGCVRPIVFITGRGDMSTAVEGMRAGRGELPAQAGIARLRWSRRCAKPCPRTPPPVS